GGGTAYLEMGVGAQYMPYPGTSAEMWAQLTAARALLDQGKAAAARGKLDAVRRVMMDRFAKPIEPDEVEYNKLAPRVGLPVTRPGEAAKPDPAKVDAAIVASWKCYVERSGKGTWLTYQFAPTGDYTLTIRPVPGT